MKRRSFIISGVSSLTLIACAPPPTRAKFKRYSGPQITGIIVYKTDRRMILINNGKIMREYKVDLGFNPRGHKFREGDGRTPEGLYVINRDNPNSRYHLSLGISYPNRNDRARAAAAGVSPGGDIFIHGGPRYKGEKGRKDWTNGCISVTDAEMEDIYAMVKVGTPILIKP